MSKEFYNTITPRALIPRTCPTVPIEYRDKTLFSEAEELLTTQAVSYIKAISDDEILICLNGVENKVYRHNSKDNKRPWKRVFEEIATLKEVSGQRISCAVVSDDFFVVSSEKY